jgi:coiled-coil and C2 domain-containing protein 2A
VLIKKIYPFVELSFQKKKYKTHTAEGSSPTWNETLTFDITADDGDFKPESLMETDISTQILYLNIFDEVVVDLIENAQDKDRATYYRREKVWLGSIEIPFTNIWSRSRVSK